MSIQIQINEIVIYRVNFNYVDRKKPLFWGCYETYDQIHSSPITYDIFPPEKFICLQNIHPQQPRQPWVWV